MRAGEAQIGGRSSINWATYLAEQQPIVGNGIAGEQDYQQRYLGDRQHGSRLNRFPRRQHPQHRPRRKHRRPVTSFSSDGTTITSSRLIATSTADVGT